MSEPITERTEVSVVIPFFNEEEVLPSLFSELDRFLSQSRSRNMDVELVFADDGSRDMSLALVRAHFGERENTQILHWDRNRGVGYAVRRGFEAASKPFVVCYDSDATYPLQEAFTMIDALKDADVVTASPFMKGGKVEGVSSYRLALSKLLSLLYRLVPGGQFLNTYSCGFRAYRRECLPALAFRADGFLSTTEILIRAVQAGLRIREIPSTLSRRKFGSSKMPVFRTALSHSKFLAFLYGGALFRFVGRRKGGNR